MDKSTAELLINGIALKREIKAEAPKTASVRELPPANSAPVTTGVPRPAMPEYVQHEQGATDRSHCRRIRSCGQRHRGDGRGADQARQTMRDHDSGCTRRDQGDEGNRGPLPRGSQARLPSNSGMLPDDGGGAQNLHGAEGKNRCSAHGACMTLSAAVRLTLA